MSPMSEKTANKLAIIVLFSGILAFFTFVHWIQGVRKEDEKAKARILELQHEKAQSETNNNEPSAAPKE